MRQKSTDGRAAVQQVETESIEAQLHRLISVHEELQRQFDERTRSKDEWGSERTLFRAMIDQVPDYLFVKDSESRFVIANRAVAADLGQTPEGLIGKTDYDLHPPALAAKFFADEQGVIQSQQPMIDIEEFVVDVAGHQKFLSTSKLPLRNDAGEVIGIVGISRDVTERKRAEDQIHHMAHHDSLTGLPNRVLLLDRLGQAFRQALQKKATVTVIFVDLDNFKTVNDSLGHAAGDTLLKTVAERMVNAVRDTDTVARLGGDEFVVLISSDDDGLAATLLNRVRSAISEPVLVNGHAFHVGSSIGVSTFPQDASDPETLLTNADIAMYRAKQIGRDNVQFYVPSMNEAAHEKRILLEGLRRGIALQEFAVVYQPQVDLRTGRIIAVEALARWNHPEMGLVLPNRFIPLAEESGAIVPLGEWVLREACRQNRAWQAAGMEPITVAVNVSARQFREANWVARVQAALRETGLDPQYLELELTESLLMHDVEYAVSTMRRLQEIGVGLAIDDFGTGYSSLSALKNFPVTRLKIDQSFIRCLPDDENDRSIAKAVIALGQQLNLKVIAEGVETDAQLSFLTKNKCDEIQGFHFSKPVDSSIVADMLRNQS